jgi:hypothetical protein
MTKSKMDVLHWGVLEQLCMNTNVSLKTLQLQFGVTVIEEKM